MLLKKVLKIESNLLLLKKVRVLKIYILRGGRVGVGADEWFDRIQSTLLKVRFGSEMKKKTNSHHPPSKVKKQPFLRGFLPFVCFSPGEYILAFLPPREGKKSNIQKQGREIKRKEEKGK